MGLLLPLLHRLFVRKMTVVLLNGIYLRPPAFFFFGGVGGFLFCVINLNLEIFKKSSYDLFDFKKNILGFSIFVFLN